MLKRLPFIALLSASFMLPTTMANAEAPINNIQNPVDSKIQLFDTKAETKHSNVETLKMETIPFETRVIENPNLPAGIRIIEQKGAYGSKTFYKTFKTSVGKTGEVTQYPVYHDEITAQPVEEIVVQGTKTEIISGVSDKTLELETEKAAELKRQEEEAAKKAAEQKRLAEQQRNSRKTNVPSDAPAGSITTPAENKAYAQSILSASEFECANKLVVRESEWKTTAENKSSGAYGVPQSLPASKLASAGADWRTNGKTQFNWMVSYVDGRYGNFCNALQHSYNKGWY